MKSINDLNILLIFLDWALWILRRIDGKKIQKRLLKENF